MSIEDGRCKRTFASVAEARAYYYNRGFETVSTPSRSRFGFGDTYVMHHPDDHQVIIRKTGFLEVTAFEQHSI